MDVVATIVNDCSPPSPFDESEEHDEANNAATTATSIAPRKARDADHGPGLPGRLSDRWEDVKRIILGWVAGSCV
jgi:hypothetical protein